MKQAHSAWRPLAAAGLSLLLAACATAPQRNGALPVMQVADLANARRCMDNLLQDHGTREIALQVDPNTGASPMMVALLSDLAPRSRALRVVASETTPTYVLRAQDTAPPPNETGPMTLDLALLNPRDLSVQSGLASHVQAAWIDGGPGQGGLLQWHSAGLAYRVPAGPGDARPQAQRALAELATMQLVGRATRLPYWRCWGASTAQPQIAAEVQDWYDGLAARPADLIAHFQHQLRLRQVYAGPVDGAVNVDFKSAVQATRERLGLAREAKLSLDFYQALLASDIPPRPQATAPAAAPAPVATPDPLPVAPRPPGAPLPDTLALHIAPLGDQQRFARGEAVQLRVQPSRDAHVWCFHQDEHRKIRRFFPNRFQSSAKVASGEGLQLPGRMGFEIAMNQQGVPETVACFATERDITAQLPRGVAGEDFVPLALASLEQVRSAFVKVAGPSLGQDTLQIRPR